MDSQEKIIVISGPSGAGKTTMYKKLLEKFQNQISFSISATTRLKRENEVDGKDYYFLTNQEFEQKINEHEFIEWEKVHNNYYGTLKSEIYRIWTGKKIPLLDVDVKGGLNIKEMFNGRAYLIFIAPPSIEELEHRLRLRDHDESSLNIRISNAEKEMSYQNYYHRIIVNQNINNAVEQLSTIILQDILQ